ncbi:putative basic-leucine zipper transcription factor E [Cinnamomum micranthum f. kanehirae]|uniref:Putative basic-leucine zipper transcription factor E n=1 Tax=Cinnamomum micranthum f. kanehirae TaxID=337451 RepID=A0A3S3MR55_9MAGN|nr:putative basic-leucine zipper transcription factor E [Cinnamomum micranthum f. kanehirae]
MMMMMDRARSDVEEHVEVERRLDHDLSRFEMVYPNFGDEHAMLLENRVDDQEAHIAQLEEENLTLKERLFLMEGEMAELKMRLQYLAEKCPRENMEEESGDEGCEGVCDEKSIGVDETRRARRRSLAWRRRRALAMTRQWRRISLAWMRKSICSDEKSVGD